MNSIVGRPYNQANLDGHYDVIVIGSGIGGLTAAALLAKEGGKKVLVLESHYTAGGYTHSYERKGYEWDVGVHYVGWVNNPDHPASRVFRRIAGENLQWAHQGTIYDTFAFQDDVYQLAAGEEAYIEKLCEYFPSDKDGIRKFSHLAREIEKEFPYNFATQILPPWLARPLAPLLRNKFRAWAAKSTKEVVSQLTNNQRLAAVLTGQWNNYGLPPSRSSFAMHAVVAAHYRDGGNYPVGGASSIARNIIPTIENAGGQVLTSAHVDKIIVRANAAVGIRLKNGDEVLGDVIVSGAGVRNTFCHLLEKEDFPFASAKAKLAQIKPSACAVQLMIGLKQSSSELNLSKSNFWIFPSYDHDLNYQLSMESPEPCFSTLFASFPSAKDPAWGTRYPDRSSAMVVAFLPYDLFTPWESTKWRRRGVEYEDFKARLTEKMLEGFFPYFPELRGKIDYVELGTPLSTAHFSQHLHGEAYGLEHTPQRFSQDWISEQAMVKNLFLTGQDTCVCGVVGALFAGAFTAVRILGIKEGRNIIADVAPWRF